jgi:hypothetical protein
VWNFFDLLVPIFNIVIISYHLGEMRDDTYKKPSFITTVHVLSSYLMWLKLFYFLRIFKSTGKSSTLIPPCRLSDPHAEPGAVRHEDLLVDLDNHVSRVR